MLVKGFTDSQDKVAPGNDESFITILSGETLPTYAETGNEPLNLGALKIPSIQIDQFKYDGLTVNDYDIAVTINFAKIKKEIDAIVRE